MSCILVEIAPYTLKQDSLGLILSHGINADAVEILQQSDGISYSI